MAEYIVNQAHWGGKDGKRHRYQPGEIREVDADEVVVAAKFKHLELRLPQLDHDKDGYPGGGVSKKKASNSSEAGNGSV